MEELYAVCTTWSPCFLAYTKLQFNCLSCGYNVLSILLLQRYNGWYRRLYITFTMEFIMWFMAEYALARRNCEIRTVNSLRIVILNKSSPLRYRRNLQMHDHILSSYMTSWRQPLGRFIISQHLWISCNVCPNDRTQLSQFSHPMFSNSGKKQWYSLSCLPTPLGGILERDD